MSALPLPSAPTPSPQPVAPLHMPQHPESSPGSAQQPISPPRAATVLPQSMESQRSSGIMEYSFVSAVSSLRDTGGDGGTGGAATGGGDDVGGGRATRPSSQGSTGRHMSTGALRYGSSGLPSVDEGGVLPDVEQAAASSEEGGESGSSGGTTSSAEHLRAGYPSPQRSRGALGSAQRQASLYTTGSSSSPIAAQVESQSMSTALEQAVQALDALPAQGGATLHSSGASTSQRSSTHEACPARAADRAVVQRAPRGSRF